MTTTIKTALRFASQQLNDVTESPALEAEILMIYVLKVERSFLYAHSEDTLDPCLYLQFNQLVLKRCEGLPIAYIIHQQEFWSLSLYVDSSTLIPRPETELLVEKALERLNCSQANILELGTGSGAISIALAHERPNWLITAVDISEPTLEIAKKNATTHHLKQITFIQSDWYSALSSITFDMIISNPPYIETADPHLQHGDLRFEPPQALSSGADGLHAIKHIIMHAHQYLTQNGFLLLEHGYQQKVPVAELMRKYQFKKIECFQDLQGHPRATIGYR